MEPEHLESVLNHISSVIETKVNGKLDKQHQILEKQNEVMAGLVRKVDAHIVRVEPVIHAYEEEKRFKEGVSEIGERVVFWGKVVGSVGVVAVAVKYALFNFIK